MIHIDVNKVKQFVCTLASLRDDKLQELNSARTSYFHRDMQAKFDSLQTYKHSLKDITLGTNTGQTKDTTSVLQESKIYGIIVNLKQPRSFLRYIGNTGTKRSKK